MTTTRRALLAAGAVLATPRIARAQETWLRSFPGMEFLDVPAEEAPEETARRAAARLR